MSGYFYGVLDVYYALMTTEETPSAAAVYGTPSVLAKTIEVTITPAYREGALYASNAAVRRTKRIDTYTVKLGLDKVPKAVRTAILGRVEDANGVQAVKGLADPPLLAIGFVRTLDNGEKECWWLVKGRFAEDTTEGKTDGEKIEYQTPTLEATFVRRMNDDVLAYVADSEDEEIPDSVFTNWLTAVYAPPAAP